MGLKSRTWLFCSPYKRGFGRSLLLLPQSQGAGKSHEVPENLDTYQNAGLLWIEKQPWRAVFISLCLQRLVERYACGCCLLRTCLQRLVEGQVRFDHFALLHLEITVGNIAVEIFLELLLGNSLSFI